MDKYILIAAPGKTDPIRGEADGPILHIARRYKPEKIILFFSEEIGKEEQEYQHIEHAINLLGERLGMNFEVENDYMGIQDPHSYDALLPLTEKCARVKEKYPEHKILLNISSGTPQIETAFCMIAISDGERYIPVQVSTPENGANQSRHFNPKQDLVEDWFEVNIDNAPDAPDRCTVPGLLNYKRPIVQFQITSMIQNYDYAGALQLYEENKKNFSEKTGLLLRHAQKRLNLEDRAARECARGLKMEQVLYPIARRDIMTLTDFYNSMQIKKMRGELNDFAMRLEILTVHLGTYILEKCMHIALNQITITTRKKIKLLSKDKCISVIPGIDIYLDEKFMEIGLGRFEWGKFVNGRSIVHIIHYLSTKEEFQKYEECVKEMIKWNDLSVEIRNPAAHAITAIEEENFRTFYDNKDSTVLCRSIERVLVRVFGTEFKKDGFDTYERINNLIVDSFDR